MLESSRRYLFLQGPVGPFFCRLAKRLIAEGQYVQRIHFNGGDRIFWRLPGAIDFKGDLDGWPAFLIEHLTEWGITDILLFGDCRPLHRVATRLAALRDIRIHVFEEGYLRPNFVTLEQGGVNGHSLLPQDPEWFKHAAKNLPKEEAVLPVRNDFFRRACEDVLYNIALVLMTWRFPGFRTHRPWHPFVEYAAGAKRFFIKSRMRREASTTIKKLLKLRHRFYLFPLQLDADSQIRYHSPFKRMAPAIEHVIDSFARRAACDSLLIITEHPLDNAVVDQRIVVGNCAAQAGISDRIVYLYNGSPDTLVRSCHGLVTVNSTIGLLALGFGIRVKPLGDAIYDFPQLTFQGDLDSFWQAATAPDPTTFDAFRRVLAANTQLNGGFYSHKGVTLAVEGAVRRLLIGTKISDSMTHTEKSDEALEPLAQDAYGAVQK